MRTGLMILVVMFQLLVLGYMAGEREWVLHRGEIIYLRTAPLDPVDPFRGSYVKLDYDISRVPTNRVRGGLSGTMDGRTSHGKLVYAAMKQTACGVAVLDYLSDEKPVGGLFLRGRVDRYWGNTGTIPVRYGLEAFFAQPGTAKQMEALRRRGEIQVPLEMEVAVSGKGVSVMKGCRWCSLGVGTKLETVSPTNRQIRSVILTLMNVSSNTLAVVDQPGGRSLSLENDWIRSWGTRDWKWVGADLARPAATDAEVMVLKPGESHVIRIDMTRPEWFVENAGKTNGINEIQQFGPMFRLMYRAPSPEECRGLKHGSLIWQGELISSAFGGGRVD
ncbi:MAG: GDYXXLXY domain-containing protein [bacterium]